MTDFHCERKSALYGRQKSAPVSVRISNGESSRMHESCILWASGRFCLRAAWSEGKDWSCRIKAGSSSTRSGHVGWRQGPCWAMGKRSSHDCLKKEHFPRRYIRGRSSMANPSPITFFKRHPQGDLSPGRKTMLTLATGSVCDVCAEEYGPQCQPHSIPCGMSKFFHVFFFPGVGDE